MKIVTVLGARPQFIKAAIVSRKLTKYNQVQEIIVHTGQHFDPNMSEIFFSQLNIPRPDYNLEIRGGSHGVMTGRMLCKVEDVLIREKPDYLMVYGDTNSTLAGALAASKLHIPVAHIEAGLRSFNSQMPEEINRIVTDQISNTLFCPTETAVSNLKKEGFEHKPVEILKVGDVMQDSVIYYAKYSQKPRDLKISQDFILATLHRAENTDNEDRLASIVGALNRIHKTIAPVVLPIHPRTKASIHHAGLTLNLNTLEPVGYLEMLWILDNCSLVLTDSGGIQKEAFFRNKACITMREQTEWTELVEMGVNELVGTDEDVILNATRKNLYREVKDDSKVYGGGLASDRIVEKLLNLDII